MENIPEARRHSNKKNMSFRTKNRLHSFHPSTLLPKWGKQRYFVCESVYTGLGGSCGDVAEDQRRPVAPAVKKSELECLRQRLKVSSDLAKQIDKEIARPHENMEKKTRCDHPTEGISERPKDVDDRGEKEKVQRRPVKKKPERVRFRARLTRQEVEEDFLKILGCKPSSRPKNKRPRNVRGLLDLLSPGMMLTEISVDTYKVGRRH